MEDIFKRLNSIKQISNSSLSGIINKVNVNFETLSASFGDYLTIINFDQTANSMVIKELTVDTIHLKNLLHVDLFGDADYANDLKIDDQGRIFAKSFTGELSEVERLRLKPLAPGELFLETGLPQSGIPGDVVFTGVDFFGYMGDSIGWRSLTFGADDLEAFFVKFDDAFSGSPGLGNNLQTVIQNLYTTINNINNTNNAANIGTGKGLFAQKALEILEFKSLTGSSLIDITSTSTEVNVDVNITGLIGKGIKYHIETTDDITVLDKYEYLVYGDLILEGTLTNYGKIVIINGALINTGTFNNFGTILLVQLALGTNKKYKASFIATAGVPFTITHNLNTLDFVYTVREGNDDAVVQLTRVNVNSVTVESSVNMVGDITIIGY